MTDKQRLFDSAQCSVREGPLGHTRNGKFTNKFLGYDELDSTGVSLGDVELVYVKLRIIAEILSHGKNHG